GDRRPGAAPVVAGGRRPRPAGPVRRSGRGARDLRDAGARPCGGRYVDGAAAARRRRRGAGGVADSRGRTMTIKVAIADDQQLVRMGLRVLVDAEDDLELAGEAEDGRQALDLVRRTRPDVILMDIRMPVMDGLDTLRT